MPPHPPHDSDTSATQWSLIDAAAGGDRAALDQLWRKHEPDYRLYALRKTNGNHHQVDDLLQQFMRIKLLEQNVVSKADPTIGFRKFFNTVFINFILDQLKKGWRESRGKRSLDAEEGEPLIEDHGDSDADLLDLARADRLLREALQRVRQECVDKQQERMWSVFEARLLLPLRDQAPVPSFEELRDLHQFESPTQVGYALENIKRKLRRHLQAVMVEDAGFSPAMATDSAIEQELLDLRSVLAHAKHRPVTAAEMSSSCCSAEESVLSVADAPERLGRVLDLAHLDSPLWLPDESAALLKDLLACPLAAACNDESVRRALSEHHSDNDSCPQRLAELFTMKSPPIGLLEAIKSWSKELLKQDHPPLPKEVSYVLHYACLCNGLLAGHRSITRLSDAEILQSVNLLVSYSWIDAALRELFEQTRCRLAAKRLRNPLEK